MCDKTILSKESSIEIPIYIFIYIYALATREDVKLTLLTPIRTNVGTVFKPAWSRSH